MAAPNQEFSITWPQRVVDAVYRFFDGDVFFSFRNSPVTIVAFVVTMIFFVSAALAPWLAPFNTNDVATLNLMDAFRPPAWEPGGEPRFLLGIRRERDERDQATAHHRDE